MVTPIYKNKYNVSNLAEKDPFEIGSIDVLANYDQTDYYASIVSALTHKIIVDSDKFSNVAMYSLGTTGKANYFFEGEKEPRVIHYLANQDEASGRLKKGDITFDVFGDKDLDSKIKKIFGILNNIENSNYELIEESDIPKAELDFLVQDKLFDFSFYQEKDGKQYFVFDFKHPKEKKKVLRTLN